MSDKGIVANIIGKKFNLARRMNLVISIQVLRPLLVYFTVILYKFYIWTVNSKV